MRYLHCACASSLSIPGVETLTLPAIPTRNHLRPLDDVARATLPTDPTPSLQDIQRSPNVAHLGAPQLAPQQPDKPLRVIVSGTDAALSAILTRMMRADYLWAHIAYIPTDPTSPAGVAWGVSVQEALDGAVTPAPCIRTDTGSVVAGAATLHHGDGTSEYVGEIVVDSTPLVYRDGTTPSARYYGQFGARLVPTPDAPGIAATPLVTPPVVPDGRVDKRGPAFLERLAGMPLGNFLTRGRTVEPALTDASRVLTGRALQSGGDDIRLTIDGVAHPRPLERVTFYRHLRDIQSVRP